ncbi:hypothetical protein [uncultured Chitinophaga sp.]|uniref:hypothetical protein n=1 Tax=uncultured Chitinophaga sp. TaxID=339340 RepID=UPI00260D59BF|nr:hypothetical protein [uncultured Chitinophaga sp.]
MRFEFRQQEIGDAGEAQLPRGAESGDASAGDENPGADGFRRCDGQPIAQPVPRRHGGPWDAAADMIVGAGRTASGGISAASQ